MKKLLLFVSMLCISGVSFGQVLLQQNFEGATFPPTGWNVVQTNALSTWYNSTPTGISGTGAASVRWYDPATVTDTNADAAGPQDESLESPSFSLVGKTSAFFTFSAAMGYDYMAGDNAAGDLHAEVSTDGSTWTSLWTEEDYGTFTDFQLLSVTLDLSAYLGQANVKVRFRYEADDADTVYVDDVYVYTCGAITAPTLAALAETTFTLNWTGSAASYDVERGPIGFTLGTGTQSNVTTASYAPTGLTGGTAYSVYIRSNCGAGSVGYWQGPYNVYTVLTTPATLNYDYGFEVPTLPYSGWTSIRSTGVTTGGLWQLFADDPTDDTVTPDAYEGVKYAAAGASSSATNAWLFSRGFTTGATGTYTIKYYQKKIIGDDQANGGTNIMNVKIGNAKTVAAMTTTLTASATINSTSWIQKTATFTPTAAGTYYVGFNCTSPAQEQLAFGFVAIDKFTITAPLGVEDNSLSSKFDVYPNPSSDFVNIANFEAVHVNSVTMTDLNGRVVKRNTYSAVDDIQVNVSDLSAGIYLMNIETDLGAVTKKIVRK